MAEKEVALAHKSIVFPKIVFDLSQIQKTPTINWLFGGLMVYHKKQQTIETGILAKSAENDGAVFEVRGVFDVKDFDATSDEDAAIVRQIAFGFLFPYLRATVHQTFALAGFTSSPFPVIYIQNIFGQVPIDVHDD